MTTHHGESVTAPDDGPWYVHPREIQRGDMLMVRLRHYEQVRESWSSEDSRTTWVKVEGCWYPLVIDWSSRPTIRRVVVGCPTCGGVGADRVDVDPEGGVEMSCGDDWHDAQTALIGSEGRT